MKCCVRVRLRVSGGEPFSHGHVLPQSATLEAGSPGVFVGVEMEGVGTAVDGERTCKSVVWEAQQNATRRFRRRARCGGATV